VRTVPILTVGDSIHGYRMVGIPDGLGAFNSDRHDFTLIMNHELLGTSGIARAHGSKGAFVSRWKIDRRTLEGGTIEMLLKGTEGHGMPDNVTIDRLGRIVMDEDPGNNARVSKVWAYQISTGEFVEVAHHNPAFFDPANLGTPAFITSDEETSGIIDAAHILGPGWFFLDVQAHKPNTDTELVEGGQLRDVHRPRHRRPRPPQARPRPR
jgi:hypothetical protein